MPRPGQSGIRFGNTVPVPHAFREYPKGSVEWVIPPDRKKLRQRLPMTSGSVYSRIGLPLDRALKFGPYRLHGEDRW